MGIKCNMQVWSNGKVKKVSGRPFPSSSSNISDENPNSHCITMSLLITLPVESTVSPLLPGLIGGDEEDDDDINIDRGERRLFNSLGFEDYAWRQYHQHHSFKDSLLQYRA